MYKELLINKLNKIVKEKAKKHFVDEEKIKITYENAVFYYLVDTGERIEKRILEI
jgi:hypothetical protein